MTNTDDLSNKAWSVDASEPDIHVHPVDDARPHILNGRYCACQPVIETWGKKAAVIQTQRHRVHRAIGIQELHVGLNEEHPN